MLISLLPFIETLKCYVVENDGVEKTKCLDRVKQQKDPRGESDFGAEIFSPGSESLKQSNNCKSGQQMNDQGECVEVMKLIACPANHVYEIGKCRPRK